MARDVEVNVTASDRTGMALASVERNFKKTAKNIGDSGGDIGAQFGQNFAKSLGMKPSFVAPLLAGVVATAPLIGAALAGAVVGGAGIGGIVGGAILAARDARVQAAGKELGKNMLRDLEQDSVAFVQPLLQQIDKVDARFDKLRPTIRQVFADSAGYLDPLVDGLLSGAEKVIGGFAKAVSRAGPVIDAFGNSFDKIGGAVGDMFSTLSRDADEGADAINDLADAGVYLIRTTTGIVHGLANIHGWLQRQDAGWDNFRYKLEDALSIGDNAGAQFDITADGLSNIERRANEAAGGMRKVGSGTFGAADAFQRAGPTAEEYARTLADAERAASDLVNANRDLFGSTTDVAGATARASEKIKENGRTLSLNSEKGRENRDALSQVANAMGRQYDATVRASGAGIESARVASNNRDAFVRLAQKAGLSASAAQNLATKLGLIPSKKETKILADTAAAEARLKALQGKINAVKGKTVTINVVTKAATAKNLRQENLMPGNSFSAGDYWRAVGPAAGASRTGGPSQVDVATSVSVNLDGQPFRQMTAREVRASERRQQWRQRVGGRA